MTPDFSALIAKLADAGFEFVIVGGYAAVTHGSSLFTRDLIVAKEAMPRDKDMIASKELRAIAAKRKNAGRG